jgi:hypothetical protein
MKNWVRGDFVATSRPGYGALRAVGPDYSFRRADAELMTPGGGVIAHS